MAETRHGGGTTTKIRKKADLVFFASFVSLVIFVSAFAAEPLRRDLAVVRAESDTGAGGPSPWLVSLSAEAQQTAQQAPGPQRPPVFRAGAHYVRVDAYPVTKAGRIVEGLTRDDFEIYEDGTLQNIESFEYIAFPAWTPEAARKDPRNQEAGYALAADPTYRVFAVVIDRQAFDMIGWNVMHRPLVDFLERTLGPKDLFGLIDSKSDWTEFVLGQKTTAAQVSLNNPAWWQRKDDFDDYEWALMSCGLAQLVPRSQVDRTYSLLEGLVRLFAAIRDERKSIIYVTNGLAMARSDIRSASFGGPRNPDIPKIGVTPGGRLGPMPRDVVGGGAADGFCGAERMRLTSIDFRSRYEELLKAARAGNVAFYPISPLGLQGYEFTREGRLDLARHRAQQHRTDSLRSLASETDGIAIVNTNDLRGGLTRIANDLHAYYVLGYYTTNTTWDGRVRSIKVKLKPGGNTIRARRQYRAPTLAEMSAMTSPPAPAARPAVPQSSPGAPALVGEGVAYRLAPRRAPEKMSVAEYARTDRIRVEWPLIGTVDHRAIRMLDRNGKPLPVDLPSAEDGPPRAIVVELPLAAFARGEYWLELTAAANGTSERRVVPLKVK